LNAGKLRLNQPMTVSAHSASMAPSKLGLRPGDTITVEQCVLALVTKSANDCAATVAETIGGSEANFARMMTDRARQIGMTRTTFRNASGLPNAGQLSTARDMARLAQSLIYDHAKYYNYFSTSSFTYKGAVHGNHNRLMARYPGMDGLKTGFINASGFNLTASATRNGRRLIGVVFGGQTAAWRDNHMADLLDEAFEGKKSAPMLVAANQSRQPKGKQPKEKTPERSMVATVASEIVSGAEEIALPRKAVAATPVAASLPRPNANGRWSIQVGAFNDKQAGQRAVSHATQQAGTLLDSATPHVMEVSTAKGTIYRARLTGLDEKTARRACSQLSKKGQNCLTVPPSA
jgi:D-alanyl-D-alanine carboxypeptidase